jgi:hypothetical protein
MFLLQVAGLTSADLGRKDISVIQAGAFDAFSVNSIRPSVLLWLLRNEF